MEEEEEQGKGKGKGKRAAQGGGKGKKKLDLAYVVWRGRSNGEDCPVKGGAPMAATMGELLHQPDDGWGYEEDGIDAVVGCPRCEGKVYLKWLCEGRPDDENGKSFNHCTGACALLG